MLLDSNSLLWRNTCPARKMRLLIPCLVLTCRCSSAGTTFPTNSSGYPSVLASPSELVELHQQTRALMFQGIASSTRRTYSSAQRKFLEFCHWNQSVHPNGSPLPATEWTLMLFASHLSNTIKASSIKVYIAAIRSLHLENGFPNPLANCLRLERVIRGIKRCQGTSKPKRLPSYCCSALAH